METIVSIVSTTIAIAAFIFGIYHYRKNRELERESYRGLVL